VIGALALVAVSCPAFAQSASAPDVSGFDQPCSASDIPEGYPQVNRFVPDETPASKRVKIRGVVARTVLWNPGETPKVCFRSGSPKARARVAQFAGEWMQYANLKLDFGDGPDLRTCQGGEAIKIDFVNTGPKVGYWSALGTLSHRVDHSMNFSFLGDEELPRDRMGRQMPEAEARRIILHVFGHAIGLVHEHQSPRSGCNAEYYEEAVIAYGALRGWPPERSIVNIMQRTGPELNATEVDRRSIMHYALPPWLFKAGEKSPCFIRPNFDLSDGDKAFVANVYRKGLRQWRCAAQSLRLRQRIGCWRVQESLQEAGIEKAARAPGQGPEGSPCRDDGIGARAASRPRRCAGGYRFRRLG
jgi:hypothetical protein